MNISTTPKTLKPEKSIMKTYLKQLNKQITELRKTFESNFPKYPSRKFEAVREFNIKLVKTKLKLNSIPISETTEKSKIQKRLNRISNEIQKLNKVNQNLID
ncbi:hypothetical protein ZONE111904_11750 [Zobellia nedashkovskayae]